MNYITIEILYPTGVTIYRSDTSTNFITNVIDSFLEF
jgi:hypothetical protein